MKIRVSSPLFKYLRDEQGRLTDSNMIVIGSRVGAQLRSNNVPDGGWYFKWFTNYGTSEYCRALQNGQSGPFTSMTYVVYDTSICPEHAKQNNPADPIHLAFTREAEDVGGQPHFHMMDYLAGDRWIGNYWGKQGSGKMIKGRDVSDNEKSGREGVLEK